jgi:hypothetical protein
MPNRKTMSRIITQFIGRFINSQLITCISLPLFLLVDTSGRTDDEKSEGNHQDYRDPVCGVPANYGGFSHG